MTALNGSDTFYGRIPVFRGFSSLMDPALYSALPDDWSIGVADIVESTKAIAQARYKAVNMAGALVDSTISATPTRQSSGNGEYSAGSIRLEKPRKTGMLP